MKLENPAISIGAAHSPDRHLEPDAQVSYIPDLEKKLRKSLRVFRHQPLEQECCAKRARKLSRNKSGDINWPHTGERICQRTGKGHCRVGKRWRSSKPICRRNISAHRKRHGGRTGTSAPPNRRQKAEGGHKLTERLRGAAPRVRRNRKHSQTKHRVGD